MVENMVKEEIRISEKLKNFITPLSKEERTQIEENILQEGCRDALIVWEKGKELILVDGHHRLEICQKHSLPYSLNKKSFKNIDEVHDWMIDNQLGRRNLTTDQLSYFRGLKYLSTKKKKGGYQNVEAKGQSGPRTSEILADEFKTSESTIKRDAKFAIGLNTVAKSNPELKQKILKGEAKVKKSDVQFIGQARGEVKIKNEADLYNKAKNIRSQILSEVEDSIKQIEEKSIDVAREIIQGSEPLFIDKGDRLNKIKGKIISAMNRTIKEKDIEAIYELKRLIDKLEYEIFQVG